MPDAREDRPSGPAAVRPAPGARLVCVDPGLAGGLLPDGGTLALTPGTEVFVGREAPCTHVVPLPKLSRRHARLIGGNGTWGIQDLNSTNGVYINGERIRTAWLKPGDVVRLGPLAFRYEVAAPTPASASVPAPAPIPAPPVRKPAAARPPVKAPRRRRWPAVLLVLGLLAGGGGLWAVNWYPEYEAGQRIEAALLDGSRAVRAVLAHGGDLNRALEDAQLLDAALERARAAQAAYPGDLRLGEVVARLTGMLAERRFAVPYARGHWREAGAVLAEARPPLVDQTRRLPRGLRPAARKELTAAIDLLDLAQVLIQLRTFAEQYPQPSADAPRKPPAEVMTLIRRERRAYSLYHRAYMETLSAEHPLLDAFVNDAEADARLVDTWAAVPGILPPPKR